MRRGDGAADGSREAQPAAGLRVELNSGGYRNYVPDWEPVRWGIEDGPNNTYRTEIQMPAVHMVAIPPGVRGRAAAEVDYTANPVSRS